MKRFLSRPSYADVVSTLCLFLLLGGATAFAATHLGKNSVGAKQIKKNAVTTAKIKNGAVVGSKLAPNSVTGGDIANGSVTSAKIADKAVTTGKLADEAAATGKLAKEAVTTDRLANDAATGAKVNEGSLHFTCNNPANATLLLGGPCVYKLSRPGGVTWEESIQACQTGVPGATLPTVAQVEAYARLGGVPWKESLAFTSDLSGSGPNPGGAWSVETDKNGSVIVIVSTPLTNNVQTEVLCEYDPATSPTPGS